MKKNVHDMVLKVLTKLSVSVAKTTVCSTTRFYMYQPKNDYDIYLQMKSKKMI